MKLFGFSVIKTSELNQLRKEVSMYSSLSEDLKTKLDRETAKNENMASPSMFTSSRPNFTPSELYWYLAQRLQEKRNELEQELQQKEDREGIRLLNRIAGIVESVFINSRSKHGI